jgi:para-nitrobenzyl esterase
VVLAAYSSVGDAGGQWAALNTDAAMWLPCLDVAEAHRGRTLVYRFDWAAAPPNERLGACHGIDIPFTFGTLDRCGWGPFTGSGEGAGAVGAELRGDWIAFAGGDDPWPAYDVERRATRVFGGCEPLVDDPRAGVRRAWRAARAVA